MTGMLCHIRANDIFQKFPKQDFPSSKGAPAQYNALMLRIMHATVNTNIEFILLPLDSRVYSAGMM